MNHLADARANIELIADARRNRGHHVTDEHLGRAAALLADLWATAVRHGITPDQPGYHTHLPEPPSTASPPPSAPNTAGASTPNPTPPAGGADGLGRHS